MSTVGLEPAPSTLEVQLLATELGYGMPQIGGLGPNDLIPAGIA